MWWQISGGANQTNQPGTLVVTKHVINDNGGNKTAGDFQVHVTTSGSPLSTSFPGSENGTKVTVSSGAYNVSEDNVFGYASNMSSGCFGTIANGENRTCIITNDDIAPNQTQISWCYQENATASTACGGIGTGSYYYTASDGPWVNDGAPVTDANWNTYDSTYSTRNARVHMYYTKHPGATSASLWQVKDGLGMANLTIPQSCWDYSPTTLELITRSDGGLDPYVGWYCWDGALHTIVQDSYGTRDVYEEGMWWSTQGD